MDKKKKAIVAAGTGLVVAGALAGATVILKKNKKDKIKKEK